MVVRNRVTLLVGAMLVLIGLAIGWASDRDEAIITVQVSSADHEVTEGYFSLGESATFMVKPGTDLHRFLSRQRGRKVKITMTGESGPTLSRLERGGH
jgi:hypothetical protein